ncbi:hypothetical protein LY90DRAFT_118112 [Neocallimastix californiae]|uniref:Uncharacterized protein n=1 Tax=Neocallimastix californiae TaxID=1754190 RepID=A0A1Y2ANE0_9FUNG|nr:hypothetical protein LY90DRAFT_118112 [Neocallimastix californiae]|eukprot:ORY24032.1 hypothetical protein LY90DRAFT_118112 [Neocallimastix californiae]
MKFQTILLFAAATSFAFANSLEVSDTEDVAPVNEDAGVASEPEAPADETKAEENPADEDAQENPADEDVEKPEDDVAENDTPADDETKDDETKSDETPADAEGSDDYDEENGQATDAADGEGSDDYNDEEGTGKVEDQDVKDAEEDSADEEEGVDGTTVAAGIAGAAALSSAGIFLWVKRSKQSAVESNPLTMV